jgi:hypothetical protein
VQRTHISPLVAKPDLTGRTKRLNRRFVKKTLLRLLPDEQQQ